MQGSVWEQANEAQVQSMHSTHGQLRRMGHKAPTSVRATLRLFIIDFGSPVTPSSKVVLLKWLQSTGAYRRWPSKLDLGTR